MTDAENENNRSVQVHAFTFGRDLTDNTALRIRVTTLGVFVGTSLCGEIARPLLNIPAEAQCDRIKWNLTLYVNPRTQSPTTYVLSSEYGYHIDNRTLIMKGSNVRQGSWSIASGVKTDPYATVYQILKRVRQLNAGAQFHRVHLKLLSARK